MLRDKIREWDGPFTAKGKLISYNEVHAYQEGFYYGAREEYDTVPDEVLDKYESEHQYVFAGFELGEFYAGNKKKVWGAIIAAVAGLTMFIRGAF